MRRLPLGLVSLLLVSCGDPAGPSAEAPAVLAVNGAQIPLIRAGLPLAIEGIGFGSTPGLLDLGGTPLDPASWEPNTILTTATTSDASALSVLTADGAQLGITVRPAPIDTVSTDTRTWTAGGDLPLDMRQTAIAGMAFPSGASDFTSILVLSGGMRGDGTLNDQTWLGSVNAEGRLTQWTAAPDTVVPPGRRLHAMVGASGLNSRLDNGGVAWMIGGLGADGRALADVYGISVTADGAYGLWTSLTQLPGDRAGIAAATGLGGLYVVGGFGNDSVARREVLMASITDVGTINGWFRGPLLPEGLAFAAAAVVDDRLYVAGGQTGTVSPNSADTANLRATVYSIALSRRTGFFLDSTWTTEAVTLNHPRARHAMLAAGGGLVVTGGLIATPPASDTEQALIVDGVLQAFAVRTAAARPGGPRWSFGAPVIRNAAGQIMVSVVGGSDTTGGTRSSWWH